MQTSTRRTGDRGGRGGRGGSIDPPNKQLFDDALQETLHAVSTLLVSYKDFDAIGF
jgi:hypothetical protein